MGGLMNTRGHPVPNNPDIFAERANTSLDVYNASLPVPATQYAGVKSAMSSRFVLPTIAPKVGAFFKDNHWRLNGLKFNWAWGANDMYAQTASLPGPGTGLNGMVRSTAFQRLLIQLHDWQTNSQWYINWNGTGGGMFWGSRPERYQYPSFRVAQIDTRTSGGPGPIGVRMQPRPRFTAVQQVQKYTALPRYYSTVSAMGPGRRNPNIVSNTNKGGS